MLCPPSCARPTSAPTAIRTNPARVGQIAPPQPSVVVPIRSSVPSVEVRSHRAGGESRCKSGQKPVFLVAHLCLVANSSADSPTSRDLAPELSVVARKGAKPVDSLEGVSAELPTLLRLPIVKDRAKSGLPPALLEALVEVLTEAVDRLGQSPRGDAARILLGLDPYSLHLTLKRRSEKAVIALYPGDETKKELSRKDKEMLLLGVADELRGMDEAHGEEGSPVGGSESPTVVARQPSAATDSPQRAAVVVATDRRRPHRSGRRFVWVGVLAVIGAAAAAGVMAASRGSTPAPGLVLSETFSERDRGWTDDATFQVRRRDVRRGASRRAGGWEVVPGTRGDRSTAAERPNLGGGAEDLQTRGGSFGLFCRDTGGLRYGARIDSDAQSYTIYKIEVSGGARTNHGPSGVQREYCSIGLEHHRSRMHWRSWGKQARCPGTLRERRKSRRNGRSRRLFVWPGRTGDRLGHRRRRGSV